ncbi:MAG: hypothetical protein WDA09_11155 [Bacteriovoracaceae bacterium]
MSDVNLAREINVMVETLSYNEQLSPLEDKLRKPQLNWSRMNQFLSRRIQSDDVFLIPFKHHEKLVEKGIMPFSANAITLNETRQVVVLFSENDNQEEIEARIVHELIHSGAFQVDEISPTENEESHFSLISRRVGFLLLGEDSTVYGSLMEEMVACFAQGCYLQEFATDDYWTKVKQIIDNTDPQDGINIFPLQAVRLDSFDKPVFDYSLIAFLADEVIGSLDLGGVSNQEKIAELIKLRETPQGLGRVMRAIDRRFGKGMYLLLRSVDLSGNLFEPETMQKIMERLGETEVST